MDTKREIIAVLDDVLCLKGRSAGFSETTALLGALPELDSMAVLSLINAIEARFAITLEDDELDGSTFATVGSLVDYVKRKVGP